MGKTVSYILYTSFSLNGVLSLLIPDGVFLVRFLKTLVAPVSKVASFIFTTRVNLIGICNFLFVKGVFLLTFVKNVVVAPFLLILLLAKQVLMAAPPFGTILLVLCQQGLMLLFIEHFHPYVGIGVPPSQFLPILLELITPLATTEIVTEPSPSFSSQFTITEMESLLESAELEKESNRILLMKLVAGSAFVITGLLAVVLSK